LRYDYTPVGSLIKRPQRFFAVTESRKDGFGRPADQTFFHWVILVLGVIVLTILLTHLVAPNPAWKISSSKGRF
jgi:hypothetical protein